MTTDTAATATWTGSKGTQLISKMVTEHLGNAIAKLRREIAAGEASAERAALLPIMEAEFATREVTAA